MKKIALFMCLAVILTGCSSKTSESSVSESRVEKSTEAITESETEPESEIPTEEQTEAPTEDDTEKPLYINNYKNEYPRASKLKIEAPGENDLMNSRKVIFSVDGGYYYDIYIGGRDSANYVLGFDSGDGNAVPIEDGEDCWWRYCRDGIIYGTKNAHDSSGKINICKYENGTITTITELPNYCDVYFTADYIYYGQTYNFSGMEIYRVDYDGENIEKIFSSDRYISEFTVEGDILYYEWLDEGAGMKYTHRLGKYDMASGDRTEFSSGEAGRINGGYMYYVSEYDLMRIDLEDHSIELVCEDVWNFEFCGDMLICSSVGDDAGTVFKIQNGEKQKIFNAKEFLDTDYYYDINTIQYQDGRLFINISSGPFYSYIAEIDTNGNFIRKFYENESI